MDFSQYHFHHFFTVLDYSMCFKNHVKILLYIRLNLDNIFCLIKKYNSQKCFSDLPTLVFFWDSNRKQGIVLFWPYIKIVFSINFTHLDNYQTTHGFDITVHITNKILNTKLLQIYYFLKLLIFVHVIKDLININT